MIFRHAFIYVYDIKLFFINNTVVKIELSLFDQISVMRTSNVDANWLYNLDAAEHDPDYLSDIKKKYQIVLDGIIKLNSFAEKARDSELIVFIDYLRELIK